MEFVQIVGESRRVMFRDRKDDRFAGSHELLRCQLLVVGVGQAVEFLHHQPVGTFVCPRALELGGVVIVREIELMF